MNRISLARHALAVAAILIVLALPGAPIAAKPHDGDTSHFALYATTNAGREYRPLDPQTLADINDAAPLTFTHEWPNLAVSADGSTFVAINPSQGSLERSIAVHDGVGGHERLAITPDETVYNPRLSADGSRLVVESSMGCGPTGCGARTWYTYDMGSGALVSTTHLDTSDPVWPDMLAPAGNRLYYTFVERTEPRATPATPMPAGIVTGPWPLQIATFDLDTGLEMARMTVREVFAGWWQGESINGMYVGEMEVPAIALSPDGSRIAVVDAAIETLTLLDAETLEVTATHSITRPESAWRQDVLEWLGIAPQTAQAKISQGRSVRATFSADGQHLYLTGHELEVGDTIQDFGGHGLGLMRIDVGSGEITAETLAGHDAETIMPAPDGRSIYVMRPAEPWWDNPSSNPNHVLQRLDAETLAPLAERSFAAWPQVMLMPMDSAQADG